MKLINPFKKQQKQKNIIEVKYSKLDHIGKVKRYEIPDKSEIDNQINNVGNQITNLNNELTTINNKVNTNINDIVNVNNRINTNINNIATNVTNINNLNTKVNKITNDLSNANIASYKGTWNSNTTYNVGDIVNIGDKFYLAVVRNTNSQPPENGNDKWKLLTFTVDTSSFITDSALNPLRNDISTNRNNISTNSNNITTLTNRVNNLTQPTQAIWREFNNKQINFYKKTISTPNNMFWYELYNQNSLGTEIIMNLKPSVKYAMIIIFYQLNNKGINWYVDSSYFYPNDYGNYNINLDRFRFNTAGYLSNQDFKPGGEGTFTANVSFRVILWELGN